MVARARVAFAKVGEVEAALRIEHKVVWRR